MKRNRRINTYVWLPVQAVLSTSFAGALCMAALGAPGAEPFRNWQEMASVALSSTLVFWILTFFSVLGLFRLSHTGYWEGSGPLFSSPVLNRAAIWVSTYLSVFAVCQLVIAARERADLLDGRPDWIFDPVFDWFGSPFLLASILLLAAYRTRGTWLNQNKAE
jgi:hypothetical protein